MIGKQYGWTTFNLISKESKCSRDLKDDSKAIRQRFQVSSENLIAWQQYRQLIVCLRERERLELLKHENKCTVYWHGHCF